MRVRLFCTAVAICALSIAGAAQTGLRSASLPDRTPQAPIPPEPPDQFLATPDTYAPRYLRPPGDDRPTLPGGYGFFGGVYVPSAPGGPARAEALPNGYLQLEVQPATAQVHVDGVFMGSVDDFRRMVPGRPLDAGTHRVELRAPRHQTVTFDVRIPPNDTITYRNELAPDTPVDRPAAVTPVPKTFYVIPGCYAGDKPPRRGSLPRRCDASQLRTVPPQVSSLAPARPR